MLKEWRDRQALKAAHWSLDKQIAAVVAACGFYLEARQVLADLLDAAYDDERAQEALVDVKEQVAGHQPGLSLPEEWTKVVESLPDPELVSESDVVIALSRMLDESLAVLPEAVAPLDLERTVTPLEVRELLDALGRERLEQALGGEPLPAAVAALLSGPLAQRPEV